MAVKVLRFKHTNGKTEWHFDDDRQVVVVETCVDGAKISYDIALHDWHQICNFIYEQKGKAR